MKIKVTRTEVKRINIEEEINLPGTAMYDYTLPTLTIAQALYIKYLRVRLDGSWRYIANKFLDRYQRHLPWNSDSEFSGNQITGMQLCSVAMLLLNEKVEDGWN